LRPKQARRPNAKSPWGKSPDDDGNEFADMELFDSANLIECALHGGGVGMMKEACQQGIRVSFICQVMKLEDCLKNHRHGTSRL
jgi:hypothetical protein